MAQSDGNGDLAASELLETLVGCWKSQAIHAFAHFQLADLLWDAPRDATFLAATISADRSALERLLLAGCTLGLVTRESDGAFALTEKGRLLSEKSPQSVRNWARWWGHALWPVWGNLIYSVQTGQSARSLLTGTTGFAHIEHDPEAALVFNKGLAEITRLAASDIVRAYDFSGFETVMDLGGGYGQLLAAILQASPSTRGILVDLPHAIKGSQVFWSELEAKERCIRIEGDFFDEIPTQADAVILKSVIHDWDDGDAARILSVLRRDVRQGAKLLLIERIVPEELTDTPAHQAVARGDLAMLVTHGAKERSEAEYRRLLTAADFTINRIISSDSGFSIVEAE